jgi:sec-independent protein translocase protein TatA
MFSVGTPELIVIMAVALIVFGPKKLPEIGKSIGQGLRELRRASRDVMDSLEGEDEPEPSKESLQHVSDSNRDS